MLCHSLRCPLFGGELVKKPFEGRGRVGYNRGWHSRIWVTFSVLREYFQFFGNILDVARIVRIRGA